MNQEPTTRPQDEHPAQSSNPVSDMDVLALEEANLDRLIFRNGWGEMVSGFFIILATLGMCGIVYNIPYLKWIRGSFYWICMAIYLVGILLARRSLKRKHPEISTRKIGQYSDSKAAPALFLVLPLILTIGLAAFQLGEWGIAIPSALVKILVMLFCFGLFSGFSLMIYSKEKLWRWLVWGFLALAIMGMMGFSVITLSNFALFTLPFGLLMFLSGVVVNVLHPT